MCGLPLRCIDAFSLIRNGSGSGARLCGGTLDGAIPGGIASDMVVLWLILVLGVGVSTGWAQGTVLFATRSGSTVDAPVTFGGSLVTGTGPDAILGQLYGGPVGSALVPVGSPVPFRSDAGRGYITAGGEVSIPGTVPGGMAHVKLKAWPAAFGDSYEAALVTTGCGFFGESPTLLVQDLGGDGRFPPRLAGLNGFDVFLCPEPSGLSLGIVGCAVLLLRPQHQWRSNLNASAEPAK